MEIKQDADGIFISQEKYAADLLKKFQMRNCKPVDTPLVVNEKLSKANAGDPANSTSYRSLVGSLLYLTNTRPDLMFATSLLSRFMHNPGQVHMGAAKRVLKYVRGTVNLGILYKFDVEGQLVGYSDSDWAGSIDDMKSTSGYVFSFGSGAFSWSSRKQETVAQSSAEAEYISAANATNQASWLRKLLEELSLLPGGAIELYVDNKSAIAMAKNPVFHGRSKHINIKYHVLREAEADGKIAVKYSRTDDQLADLMTKALQKTKLEKLRSELGVLGKITKEEFVNV